MRRIAKFNIKDKRVNQLNVKCRTIRKQLSEFLKIELGLEVYFQASAQIILYLFATTQTPTTGGLETLFRQSSLLFLSTHVVLAISIALSMKTSISLHVKSIKAEKGFFKTSTRFIVVLWGLFSTLRRTLGITVFFIPSLGLFDILHHYQFERVPFKIRLDRAKSISPDDKIALYGMNETVYWSQLDRWNYDNPDKATPPEYSLYTGLSLGDTFVAFLTLMAVHFITIIISKLLTSKEFRGKSDLFNKFVHAFQNMNFCFPYKDWDSEGHSLKEYKQRWWRTNIEMGTCFIVNFVFSLMMMCPLWYTGG